MYRWDKTCHPTTDVYLLRKPEGSSAAVALRHNIITGPSSPRGTVVQTSMRMTKKKLVWSVKIKPIRQISEFLNFYRFVSPFPSHCLFNLSRSLLAIHFFLRCLSHLRGRRFSEERLMTATVAENIYE